MLRLHRVCCRAMIIWSILIMAGMIMGIGLKIKDRNLIKFVTMAKGKDQKVCMMMNDDDDDEMDCALYVVAVDDVER